MATLVPLLVLADGLARAAILLVVEQHLFAAGSGANRRAAKSAPPGGVNPRRRLSCQTGVETAIATPGPFLGLRPSPFLCEKALDALYNFPAA